jgi:hypothetical protein
MSKIVALSRPLTVVYHKAATSPCPLNNHAGKYTTSKLPYRRHPNLESTCFLSEMSKLNHGHALWSVALRSLANVNPI